MNNLAKHNEVFLERKTKKTWIEPITGHKCVILYARSLYITWSWTNYWTWNCFKETSAENTGVAKLNSLCWLDVRGKLRVAELTPGIEYEIFYELKLTKSASGWELPVIFRLTLPDGTASRERQVSLLEKPRGEWFEIRVGSFMVEKDEFKEVHFDFIEHGGHWKTGLLIRAAILRPKR